MDINQAQYRGYLKTAAYGRGEELRFGRMFYWWPGFPGSLIRI
jgi:hypothetical protein